MREGKTKMNDSKFYYNMSDEELQMELYAAENKKTMIESIIEQRQKEKVKEAWANMMEAIRKYINNFGPIYVQTDCAGLQEFRFNDSLKDPGYFECGSDF